jgi:holin-like protein
MHNFWRRVWTVSRRRLRGSRLLQVAIIIGLWWLCDYVVRGLSLAVPGAVLGMLTLLALFASGHLHARSLARGADWLLAEMLLFFVPAIMVLIDMPDMMGWLGIKLMFAVVVGASAVMLATAAAVHAFMRWERLRDD